MRDTDQFEFGIINLAIRFICAGIFILIADFASATCLGLGASERLELRCLIQATEGRAIDARVAQLLDTRLKNIGINEGLGIERSINGNGPTLSLSIYPILRFEPNINGGNPRKTLQVGDLVFNSEPENLQTSGAVLGLGVSGRGRYAYGSQQFIDYSLRTSLQTSPWATDKIRSSQLRICNSSKLHGAFYLDVCGALSEENKTLSQSRSEELTVGMLHIGNLLAGEPYEFGVEVQNLIQSSNEQKRVQFKWGQYTKFGVVNFKTIFGEPSDTFHSLDFSYDIQIGSVIAGKRVQLSLSTAGYSGSQYFGVERKDRTTRILSEIPVGRGAKVQFGFSQNDSSIDYFSSYEPILEFKTVF